MFKAVGLILWSFTSSLLQNQNDFKKAGTFPQLTEYLGLPNWNAYKRYLLFRAILRL